MVEIRTDLTKLQQYYIEKYNAKIMFIGVSESDEILIESKNIDKVLEEAKNNSKIVLISTALIIPKGVL
jgi:hypothetical protein